MDKALSGPVRHLSSLAARLAFGAAITAMVLLAALHVLRPDLDPTRSMVSEYGVGPFGWVQTLVFLLTAASAALLLLAMRSAVKTLWGRIGLVILALAAIGFFLGAVFNANHPLHMLAFFIGTPAMSLAPVLISVSVARNPAWASVRRRVVWVSQLPWIGFVVNMVLFFAAVSPSGEFNPSVPVGLANRLFWLCAASWLSVMAWQVGNLSGQKSA